MSENVDYQNIIHLIKDLVMHLVDCDNFTFIQIKTDIAEVFTTTND